jgi:integrase
MEYIAKWVRFLRARGVADIPLADFSQSGKRHIDAYFADLHIAKKHKLSTMHRENDSYETLMNFGVSRGWAPEDYPRAELPKWEIAEQPVNKWLYPEEIRLFIRLAPKHLRLFVAGVFATGIRGGELLYASRRQPNYGDPNSTGISLEPGREHIYLGWTKSRKPVIRSLPDWWIAMLVADLAIRQDQHNALFLTEDGVPYKRPRRQRGFAVKKTAWRGLRRRVAAVIGRLARVYERGGQKQAAARLRDRAATCLKVTPHWGRHNAASHLTMKGMADSAVQRGGGWQTAAMLRRYQHLAPEASKDLANALDFSRSDGRRIVQTRR